MFLSAAEQLYPELRVFACLSSHAPIFEYCSEFADSHGPAKGLEVNWTRTGQLIAQSSVGRSNFHGIYIDDWYVIMCSVQTRQYVRHGSKTRRPCLRMSDMKQMRNAMRQIQPHAIFMPLVYHDQLGLALDGGYAVGAAERIPFGVGDVASVTFYPQRVATTANQVDTTSVGGLFAERTKSDATNEPVTLSFFYRNMLNVWTRGEGVAKTAGQVYLDVMCDGDLVHSVDTALDMSVVLANISLRSVPDNISFVARPCKTSDSSTLRISYVFGVQLISASGQNLLDPANFSTYVSQEQLTANTTDESVVTGTADAIVALQAEDPSTFVAANYTELLHSIAKQGARGGTAIYGGHYARCGLKWTNAVDAMQIKTAIELDVAAQLPVSLVWQSPMSLWRCRSSWQICTEGAFAEKILSPASKLFSKVMLFPTNYIFEPGWFSRYFTAGDVTEVSLNVGDSQRAAGNRSNVIYDDQFFQKRVYGLHSNRTYYRDFAGVSSDSKAFRPCTFACPGADIGAHCQRNCSTNGIERLHLVVKPPEPLAVELMLMRDVSHTRMALSLGVGSSRESIAWKFESQVRDILTPTSREIFNATLAAWGAGGM
jgi:hypothetical protein